MHGNVMRRPSQDTEIEKMYAAALDEMALPEAKRAEMIACQSLDRKWQLLMAHNAAQKVQESSESQPSFWIKKLLQMNNGKVTCDSVQVLLPKGKLLYNSVRGKLKVVTFKTKISQVS